MQSHGFVSGSSASPPRVDELRRQLKEVEQTGYSGQGARSDMFEDLEAWALTEGMKKLGKALPDTLQRVGPEIYRNLIGGAGRRALRDIIDDYFPLAVRHESAE